MIGRNVDDHFAKTPTPHYPRSRFDNGIKKRLQTQGHGRLYPFFARLVYPGDTWQMDLNTFVRMDTSIRVPLDDIYLDTYFFFVPLRILDKDFAGVLGEGEPEDYSDVSKAFPDFLIQSGSVDNLEKFSINCLLPYLGYNQASCTYNSSGKTFTFDYPDHFCPYSLAAYYKVYNDWFRDENLDPSIPYGDLYNSNISMFSGSSLFAEKVDPAGAGATVYFNALKINKFHDYFTSGMIAPQKGPAVTIPLGTSAPVGIVAGASGTASSNSTAYLIKNGATYVEGNFYNFGFSNTGGITGMDQSSVVADLSHAAGTINELKLALSLQALYEKRATFGTRFIEHIRGQWGIEVPDSFFLRPEYLGGSRVTLNNVPVLSTENSSQLGQMAGNSSTLANGGSFSKTFIEYGVLLGVSCTRIKHSYTQGKRKELFGLKTQLDLYNPVFANIGPQPTMQNELYNMGDDSTLGNKDVVFNYQEPWADLKSDFDSFAGLFGVLSNNNDIRNKWHYGDYYSSAPSFDADWLKEDQANITRTLTGQLITDASSDEVYGHQFMFGYYYHAIATRIMNTHPDRDVLIGRL